MGIGGLTALVLALQHESCCLLRLDLRDNDLGHDIINDDMLPGRDLTVPLLVAALHRSTCKLTFLNLGGNMMDDLVKVLVPALHHPTCGLTSLDLSDNELDILDVEALALALQDEDCRLTTLDLYDAYTDEAVGEGYILDVSMVSALITALTHTNCRLTEINLGGNRITMEGLALLAGALQHEACRLTILRLWDNLLGCEGARALVPALTHPACKLTILDLKFNGIGIVGIGELSRAARSDASRLASIDVREKYPSNVLSVERLRAERGLAMLVYVQGERAHLCAQQRLLFSRIFGIGGSLDTLWAPEGSQQSLPRGEQSGFLQYLDPSLSCVMECLCEEALFARKAHESVHKRSILEAVPYKSKYCNENAVDLVLEAGTKEAAIAAKAIAAKAELVAPMKKQRRR